MFMYKQIYMQHLDCNGVKYTEPREDIVKVLYSSQNTSGIPIWACFDEDGEGLVQFKCFDIINMKDKRREGIVACNELNCKWRWVKFYIDEDDDVICEADSYIDEDNCGRVCEDMMDRMADIIEKSFPVLGKAKFV